MFSFIIEVYSHYNFYFCAILFVLYMDFFAAKAFFMDKMPHYNILEYMIFSVMLYCMFTFQGQTMVLSKHITIAKYYLIIFQHLALA